MITFKCESCGRQVRVASEQAGRKGRCPGCHAVLLVPRPDIVSLEKPKAPPEDPDDDELLAQFAYSHSQVQRMPDSPEANTQRRFPLLMDVFLYPFSISGVANLCIFWFLPILLSIVPPIGLLGLLPALAEFAVTVYMYYFLLDCIRDSAAGGTRAPENVGSQPGFSDIKAIAWQVVVSIVIFWGPLIGYLLYAYNVARTSPTAPAPDPLASPVFWCVLAWGILFFPVGVLAVALMELSEALKPWIWIKAIARVPGSYCGLVLACIAMAALLYGTGLLSAVSPVLALLFRGVDICLLMTLAHLIGRFYHTNADRIAWEI